MRGYYRVLHSGGPDGEIGASLRYLSQRFTMPNRTTSALLNDIGTEELSHLEMVSTIVHQLTRDLSMEEIEKSGFGPYYIDHTVGVWPQAAGGVPFNACEFQSKGDPITDLFEDLAAEQKARSTYDNILRVVRNIFAYGAGQPSVGDAGHGPLHDGIFNAQKLCDTGLHESSSSSLSLRQHAP